MENNQLLDYLEIVTHCPWTKMNAVHTKFNCLLV